MTDHQTMIREVCERLSRNEIVRGSDLVWRWEIQPFEPHKRYDHCHLLIDWMVEAGWKWGRFSDGTVYLYTEPGGSKSFATDPDFKIAVLTVAWRALKDELEIEDK